MGRDFGLEAEQVPFIAQLSELGCRVVQRTEMPHGSQSARRTGDRSGMCPTVKNYHTMEWLRNGVVAGVADAGELPAPPLLFFGS
jgi:hypothetical protein